MLYGNTNQTTLCHTRKPSSSGILELMTEEEEGSSLVLSKREIDLQ